jgi:hypothetical protein
MADYFTNFSLVLELNKEAKRYALDLAKKAGNHRSNDEPVPDGFPTALVDVLEDWCFETDEDKESIWLHSQYGGIDAVCAFIQHLMGKFNLNSCVTFEWSHDCTRPCVDAYGGGAAIITAHEIKTFTTSEWLSRTVR